MDEYYLDGQMHGQLIDTRGSSNPAKVLRNYLYKSWNIRYNNIARSIVIGSDKEGIFYHYNPPIIHKGSGTQVTTTYEEYAAHGIYYPQCGIGVTIDNEIVILMPTGTVLTGYGRVHIGRSREQFVHELHEIHKEYMRYAPLDQDLPIPAQSMRIWYSAGGHVPGMSLTPVEGTVVGFSIDATDGTRFWYAVGSPYKMAILRRVQTFIYYGIHEYIKSRDLQTGTDIAIDLIDLL